MTNSPARNLAAEYSEKSEAYVRLWAPVIRPMAQPLLAELPLSSARWILDCGTGPGTLIPDLAAAAPKSRIAGIDSAEKMLNLAPKSSLNSYVVMDAQALAFRTGLFDVATLAFVLFHLTHPLTAIREVLRALVPGGTLGIVVWGKDMDVPGLAVSAEELDRAGAAPDQRSREVMRHDEMNDLSKLRSLLEASGAVRVRTFSRHIDYRWTAETLAATQLACGVAGRRVATLTRHEASDCAARVLSRFKTMSEAQMLYSPEILFGIGEKRA